MRAMKRLVAVLLLAASSLFGQQDEIQSEAVRAFQAGDYAMAKSLFESLLAIDSKNPRREVTCEPLRSAKERPRIGEPR
jgi:cytochrome c-type biogenesis protein CcmH/NrfG